MMDQQQEKEKDEIMFRSELLWHTRWWSLGSTGVSPSGTAAEFFTWLECLWWSQKKPKIIIGVSVLYIVPTAHREMTVVLPTITICSHWKLAFSSSRFFPQFLDEPKQRNCLANNFFLCFISTFLCTQRLDREAQQLIMAYEWSKITEQKKLSSILLCHPLSNFFLFIRQFKACIA